MDPVDVMQAGSWRGLHFLPSAIVSYFSSGQEGFGVDPEGGTCVCILSSNNE